MNNKGVNNFSSKWQACISYGCLIVLLMLALALLFFIVSTNMATIQGKKPLISVYTIVSPSMEPTIKVYDVIIDKRVSSDASLKVGDIITFYSDKIDTGGYTVTHRINDIYKSEGKTYYITKGDNNIDVDEGLITIDNIVGKCERIIPSIGKLQVFISSKVGWICVILIPAIGIILIDIKKIIKVFKIKEQIAEIPEVNEIELIREKEENKKLLAIVEEANRFNRVKKKKQSKNKS